MPLSTSNLTRAQFELLNEVIPESKPGGRPREVDMGEMQNSGAIRYRTHLRSF